MTPPLDVRDCVDCGTVVACANGNGLLVDMINTSCMVVVVLLVLPALLVWSLPTPLTLNIVAGCNDVNVIDCGGDADGC